MKMACFTLGMYDWYPGALSAMIRFTNSSSGLSLGCKAAHKPGDEWLCGFANYTLPYTKTPTFTVQQSENKHTQHLSHSPSSAGDKNKLNAVPFPVVSTWDAQCMGRGQIAPPPLAFIQIQCSVKAMHCQPAYTAVQYPDLMQPDDVRDWWAPYQRKYLADFTHSGAHQHKGNGGFFHQCFLGAAFYTTFSHTCECDRIIFARLCDGLQQKSPDPAWCGLPADSWNSTHCARDPDGQCLPRPNQGLWNEIAVGGSTMRQAISTWWNADDTKPAPFLHDLPWYS